jgi:hypothetical protein
MCKCKVCLLYEMTVAMFTILGFFCLQFDGEPCPHSQEDHEGEGCWKHGPHRRGGPQASESPLIVLFREHAIAGDCWRLDLVPMVGRNEVKAAQGLVPTIGTRYKELTLVICSR